MTSNDLLDFYATPTEMTSFGPYGSLVASLPDDVEGLVRIIQGLVVHEYMAQAYGLTIPEERKSETHIRSVQEMTERMLAIDDRPLTVARPVDRRLVGVCHHPMLFLVAMLRARSIPVRGRCGFGSYFNPGYFEDHWVAEYWNEGEQRWILVDPQFDDVWRKQLTIRHDIQDVPRDRFLVASDAWNRCREGKADPARFGIFKGDLRGLWFIAGDLIRDVASLNKVEMLPWDVWGAMSPPGEDPAGEDLVFFDRLASLTRVPDRSFDELVVLYQNDDRLKVPSTVFNSLLQHDEAVGV